MIVTPFTLEQAQNIAEDFQYLIGKKISESAPESFIISTVTISPFDLENKEVFFENLRQMGNVNDALSDYTPVFFDVVIIAYVSDQEWIHRDIRTYVKEYGIKYPFPDFPLP